MPLKRSKKDGVVLERLNDKINVEVAADAVVLSLGFRPDNHLVEELKSKKESMLRLSEML